jgi:hypothetical protein
MMEAVRTSETAVYFCDTTRRHIPEGCHLHTRRRGKLSRDTLRVFEKRVLRRMLVPKKENGGGLRDSHIEEIHNLQSSTNIIQGIKSE